jgi:PAS domain-containing protein
MRGRKVKTSKHRDASNSRCRRSSGSASDTELASLVRERNEVREQRAATSSVAVYIDEVNKAEGQPKFEAQLQTILNVLPAYTWYCAPSGALTFVNKRTAEYLGLPKDHPLRFGIDIGAPWDNWAALVHPDDREEARKHWSTCLRTGQAADISYRVRSAQGDYRWFLSRGEPLRAADGTSLLWVGQLSILKN